MARLKPCPFKTGQSAGVFASEKDSVAEPGLLNAKIRRLSSPHEYVEAIVRGAAERSSEPVCAEEHPSAAKAAIHPDESMARLKPCPFKTGQSAGVFASEKLKPCPVKPGQSAGVFASEKDSVAEPGLLNAKIRRLSSPHEYVEAIVRGDRAVLARAITLVESSRAADAELAQAIVEGCLPQSGRALRVGITGVPGAGKSTLIEALGQFVVGEYGESVAVLAIDPTSQVTGGSILGDKTRMTGLAACEKAFIRPSPSRGSSGGVARHTREAMVLCEAAGFQNILIETVGVGQSETAVHGMVDFFVLVMLTGAGDELQGMKRGVMELADLVVVNKADGENVAAAERTRTDAEKALHFFMPPDEGWRPCAVACSALTGRGVAELWSKVREYATAAKASGWFEGKRREQRRRWLRESLEAGLAERFRARAGEEMAAWERAVVEGRATPVRAARELLEMYAAGRALKK